MLFSRQNLSGVVPQFADGDVIEDCNLSQPAPHTSLGTAKRLLFRRCNLVNCDAPKDAKLEGCLNCHVAEVPVLTRTAAAVQTERVAIDAAIAAVEAQFEAQKAAAIDAAVMKAKSDLLKAGKTLAPEGLTPKQNPDGTWTYYRREIVP